MAVCAVDAPALRLPLASLASTRGGGVVGGERGEDFLNSEARSHGSEDGSALGYSPSLGVSAAKAACGLGLHAEFGFHFSEGEAGDAEDFLAGEITAEHGDGATR